MTVYPSKIKGKVKVSGSKNSALAILCASLVTAKKVKLNNVSDISDIKNLFAIFQNIGVSVDFNKNVAKVDSKNITYKDLHFDLVKKFRASYYLMSVFLVLFKRVSIYYPGGCSIGSRPIDFHLEGFIKAGCSVNINGDIIDIKVDKLKPFIYRMGKKSLGATVNLLILASKTNGTSIIKNASTEPEVDDLISFINKGYAYIKRKGNDIIISGNVNKKEKVFHKIMFDRIECFTFMCIGTQSKKLTITGVDPSVLVMPIYYLKNANANIKVNKKSIVVKKSNLDSIVANSFDYPSLSTDQMPMLYPLYIKGNKTCVFTEGIFEGRFTVLDELKKTNANITYEKNKALITGCDNLVSANFMPNDLRAAASLLIASIIIPNSTIYNLEYLERGYENIYNKLKKIGLNFKIDNNSV